MSLFNDFRRLFAKEPAPTKTRVLATVETLDELTQPEPLIPATARWPLAVGTSRNIRQERDVNFHNNAISGRCTGRIGELSGAMMIYVFEDLPTWLTSLQVRLSIETEGGDVRLSLLEPGGSTAMLTAPGTLAGQFAISNGCLVFRCETGAKLVRGLYYEAVII